MKLKYSRIPLVFLLGLSATFGQDAFARRRVKKQIVRKVKTDEVSLMTFNVENLFDTKHDKNKDDYAFLPIEQKKNQEHVDRCNRIEVEKWKKQCLEWDWSEKALKTKYQRLTQVLRQVDEGQGPDVVVLQEVENMNVLEGWRKKHLARFGYQRAILLEGDDARGIDVAMLTKLPVFGTPSLHMIPFVGLGESIKKDTRGILEVTLVLPDGSHMTVLGVHFPAPFHPAEMRVQALDFLQKLLEKLENKNKKQLVVAAGDFNIPVEEDKKNKVLDTMVRPSWIVVHDFCQDCLGTTYYEKKKSWSFLDMILVSKNAESSKWKVDPSSVAVINIAVEQKTKKGYPKNFQLPEATGVSDHWPLSMTLRIQPQQ